MGEVVELKKKPEENETKEDKSDTNPDLEMIARKNAENAERLKRERIKHNSGVIRSYRLKK